MRRHKENSQALCEANYKKLVSMLPEIAFFEHVSLVSNEHHVVVSIDVIERTTYTILINLKSSCTLCSAFAPETVMQIRIYHDADVAEVIKIQGHQRIRPHYVYPNTAMYLPDEKRQSNQLLRDILDFCRKNNYTKELLVTERAV